MKPSRLDDTTRIDTRSRPAVPRPTLRPPPVQDDEGATRVFTVPVKRLEVAPPSSRPRNSFPEPPRDRPRVFAREPQMDVTTLRPSLSDERTSLRPQMSSEPPPAPSSSHASIPPSAYSVPSIETNVAPPKIVAMMTASRMRIALIAAAATAAPFAIMLALLGSVERPTSSAMASASQAVSQASTFIAQVAPPPGAPAPVVTEQPSLVASAKRFPAIAPVTPAVAPPPRPPNPTAVAAAPPAPRPPAYAYAAAPAPRPAAPAARPATPKTKTPTATELPDAQAADALARAQLEAALR